MRGADSKQDAMFTYVSPGARVPVKHSFPLVRAMTSEALAQMDERLEKLYSQTGRPSIAPERLVRALLLQVRYSIRSERLLIEKFQGNLLFRWVVGLSVDEPAWDHSIFRKNRDRLLEADIARELFGAVVDLARMADLLSAEHFSVHGLMIAAWAWHKSLRLKDGSGGGGGRNGLIIAAQLNEASDTTERSAGIDMLGELPSPKRCTLAADKNDDTREFVRRTRELKVTPHVAQNIVRRGSSAIKAPHDPPCRIRPERQGAQVHRGVLRLGERHRTSEAPEGPRPLEDQIRNVADFHRLQPGAHAQSPCTGVHIAQRPS